MINCPKCFKNTLSDSGRKTQEKESSVQGQTFPEGKAISGKSQQTVLIAQCSNCQYVGVLISRSVEFLLEAK